jgi:HEAT repeat protein
MRYALRLLLIATIVSAGTFASADDAATLARLDELLPAVASFEHGQNSGPLNDIEQIVFSLAPDSKLRGPVETKLLAALQSATTRDGRVFLCGQLQVVGTARSIASLEALLTDADSSHAARSALGRFEFPEAAEALHRALGKTSGKLQAGILHTLGDRRHQAAQPDCIRLLGSADPDVALAAARALGLLGGEDAVRALRKARPAAAGPLAAEIDNGLLNSAAQLASAGKADEAAAIYESFYQPSQSRQLRSAGLRGLVATRPAQAGLLLAEAIRQEDRDLSRYAISLIEHASGAEATKAFVDILGSLPAENQVLMLRALGVRGDSAAAEAVAAATKSEDQNVRVAALEALGSVGDPSSIPVLIQAAATGGRGQEVARRSLLLLPGKEIDPQLVRAMSEGSAAERAEAIQAVAGRGVSQAVGSLFESAAAPEEQVRSTAIAAIGVLAGPADLDRLVQLAVAARDPQSRAAVVEAAGKAFRRFADSDRCAGAVLAQLERVPADARPALVRLLGKSTADRAIVSLRAAAKDADPAVREAAAQALAQWPDARVTDDLLVLIQSADRQELKELALQGYLRLALVSDDPTAMYLGVMQRVTQTNDKKLVLAGLGQTAESPAALQLALQYLNDQPLQATAGLAALRIANRLRNRDESLARAALRKVLEVVDHDDVRGRAREVLNDMDKYQDHILKWVGVGPFTEKGKDGAAVYRTAFAPEKDGVEGIDWQPITKGIGSWDINLEATYGGLDYVAAYVRTRVWSDSDRNALLELGSDDGVKAWLNGRLVFDHWNEGGIAPRQKLIPVKLAKGWNDVMLKVVDQQGGWAFCCRIRQLDGTALEGMRVELP